MALLSTHFAALSNATLEETCESVAEALGLDAFEMDSEQEGDDWWEYASAITEDLALNISRLGHFSDPTKWRWMLGAPDAANYQIVLHGKEARVARAKLAMEQMLGALTPYPAEFFHK